MSISLAMLVAWPVSAKVEVFDEEPVRVAQETPKVGRGAAAKYFDRNVAESVGSNDHFLAIHIGGFMDSTAYKWGGERVDNPGRMTIGLSYRMGEWTNSMDLLFRADFNSYEFVEGKSTKMSLMPIIFFPDASSQFPLYFGVGLGAGIFFKQLQEESALALDYQLIAGARFFDVFEGTGFFLESGVKNHLLVLSDGQFNGVFLALGALFTF